MQVAEQQKQTYKDFPKAQFYLYRSTFRRFSYDIAWTVI
jgi:hypothetical protein